MSTARTATPYLQPATAEQLLDHEEARAIHEIADSVQRLGDDPSVAANLRRRIRPHPLRAAGPGASLGFVGGPLILRAFERMLTATSSVPNPASRRLHTLPGLVLASLRVVRAGR